MTQIHAKQIQGGIDDGRIRPGVNNEREGKVETKRENDETDNLQYSISGLSTRPIFHQIFFKNRPAFLTQSENVLSAVQTSKCG